MKEETKCFGAEREVRKADETGGGGNQGNSGMGADFCQQEVSVTMVTEKRNDVIPSKWCLAWWGYFWRAGSASMFFTLSNLFLNIRREMATFCK